MRTTLLIDVKYAATRPYDGFRRRAVVTDADVIAGPSLRKSGV
jgi:hypothetical protein